MSEKNYRQERIERLLHELRYEVERGMMQGEIDETLGFEFFVPVSKKIPDGVVHCQFRTQPRHRSMLSFDVAMNEPRLRVVGGRDAPPAPKDGEGK